MLHPGNNIPELEAVGQAGVPLVHVGGGLPDEDEEVPQTGVESTRAHIAGSLPHIERSFLSQQKGGPEVPHITHSVEEQLGNNPLVH